MPQSGRSFSWKSSVWLVQVFPLVLMLDTEFSPLEGALACGQSPPGCVLCWTGCIPRACLRLGNPQRPVMGIITANHQGFAQFYCSPSAAPSFLYKEGEPVAHSGLECRVWNAQFCCEVLCNASALSLYHGPDCSLVYSQAEKKVNTGLRHPYAMGTGCMLG